MGRLIQISTGRGDEKITIESTDVNESQLVQAGVADRIEKNLQIMLNVINPICEALVNNIKSLGDNKPTSSSAEFGLNFSAEGNIYFVKAAGEASIKVVLNWQ